MDVTAPDGSVIPLNYGAPGTPPTLPNGQTLAQYQGSLLFGITPKMPAASTAVTAPSSGQTQAQLALAALGVHPAAQAQPSTSSAAPSSFGGLGGLGGMSVNAGPPRQTGAVAPIAAAPAQTSAQAQAARLLGVAPTPAKPAAAPQPVATPQQSLLGLLTAQPAAKPAALPAATSKAPNKTTVSLLTLLTPKPATAAKKPAGKTNR
jgi:hypothetical protein